MATRYAELVERLNGEADRWAEQCEEWIKRITETNPGVDFSEAIAMMRESTDREAAAAITALEAEVDRCHARLEIDHYFKIGDNDDSDLERVDTPMDERAGFPDGISARDATIELIEESNAEMVNQRDKLAEALNRIAAHTPGAYSKTLLKIARDALSSIESKP